MLDKQTYRIKCKVLASQIARLKLEPHKIPEYISRQKWFMQIQGMQFVGKEFKGFSQSGAFQLFGKEWCDKCMRDELLRTGHYCPQNITNDPTNINSFFDIGLTC